MQRPEILSKFLRLDIGLGVFSPLSILWCLQQKHSNNILERMPPVSLAMNMVRMLTSYPFPHSEDIWLCLIFPTIAVFSTSSLLKSARTLRLPRKPTKPRRPHELEKG